MRRSLISTISILILFLLCSCEKESSPFAGLKFGMTKAQVDSVAQKRHLVVGEWDKPNEVRYSNGIEMFGQTWRTLICCFENGKLDHFLLSHSPKTHRGDDSILHCLSNSFISDFRPSLSSILGHPYINENDVVGNSTFLVRIYEGDDNTSLQVYPFSEENAEMLSASHYQITIDKQLEKLSTSMHAWLTESNKSIRDSYGRDVIDANQYLEDNLSKMTHRQLEWYNKLKSVKAR